MNKETIKSEIASKVGSSFSLYRIGLTHDPAKRKQEWVDESKNVKYWKQWQADTLSDAQEIANGTNPLDSDSDGDEVNDKDDYDPLNPSVWEEPTSSQWSWFVIILAVVIVVSVIFIVIFTLRKKR